MRQTLVVQVIFLPLLCISTEGVRAQDCSEDSLFFSNVYKGLIQEATAVLDEAGYCIDPTGPYEFDLGYEFAPEESRRLCATKGDLKGNLTIDSVTIRASRKPHDGKCPN